VVLHGPLGQPLVRHHQPAPVVEAHVGVGELHVLHLAGLLLEGHEIPDADRLRDREQDPGDRVGERRPRGEAHHQTDHGGGGEDAGGQPPRRLELRERERDADHDDAGEDQPAHQAQPRGGHRGQLAAGHGHAQALPAARQRAVHQLGAHEREHERAPRVELLAVVVDERGRVEIDARHDV
jgi:hypothetical protein